MFDFEQIAVDPLAAEEGVWAPYIGGSSFKVRRPGPKYRERLLELYNENIALIKSESPEGNMKALEVQRRAYAEHILIGWKGVFDKGVEVEYSPERAYTILSNPRYQDFHEFLDNFVNNRENYKEAAIREASDLVKDSAVS